ncbi:AAA family ATPase [Candidatus Woesearchaeota archaeon]|jgi:ATP-dependent Clp protease ATP-binding subunit ClpX|nr:AAA family ATPase [Candidatus Woesearchaeota archaeon]
MTDNNQNLEQIANEGAASVHVREPKKPKNDAEIEWDDPVSIKTYLDKFVYGQEAAKRALSVAFSDYMSLGKQSHSLLIGPSGSGKTYMISVLCDAAGIPFAKKSLARLSSEGYKGENLSGIVEALKDARKGILFFDEFDKVAVAQNSHWGDSFPKKLQEELLSYFTGEIVHGVDTSRFLIVAAGAFHGGFGKTSLYQVIQKRLGGSQAQVKPETLLEQLVDQDLMEYGLMPELVGRLANKAPLVEIDSEGLYEILSNKESSPAKEASEYFQEMGITLLFEDSALQEIAKLAKTGVGVRGLHSVVNQLVNEYSFDRKKLIGTTITIDKAKVVDKFEKEIQFEEPDEIEIDWMNPESIINYLDNYVVGQTEGKQELAKAFHLYHLKLQTGNPLLPKSNVLILGPSGSGKTYMIELLAKKAQLPMAKTNAAGKVSAAYSGDRFVDVFDQFSESQTTGIVYVDEVDKVLLNPGNPVNSELTGCLENGEVGGRHTGGYLFILSGAFQPLYDYKRRLLAQQTEDGVVIPAGYEGIEITRDDLQEVGISPEILGRVPILAKTEALSIDDLATILTKKGSVLEEYGQYFESMGKSLEMEDGALRVMAEHAYGLRGARGLKDVANRLFGSYIMGIAQNSEEVIRVTEDEARRVLG